jgi:hypothetical protein
VEISRQAAVRRVGGEPTKSSRLGFAIVASLALGCCPTFVASAMTCEDFKQKLVEKIHEGGDRVALPSGYRIGRKHEGDPVIRYDLDGVVGLQGSIDCHEGDGFAEIDIEAQISADETLAENVQRVIRLTALGAAALCVVEPMPTAKCQSTIEQMYVKAASQFVAAKKLGHRWPGGSETRYFPDANASQAIVMVVPGNIAVSVTPPPLP